MSEKRVVRITCDTKDALAPDKLTPLQGELKSLTDKKYEKLKASLLRHGFVFPEYVWKSGKTNYVTDGHQRLRALSKMKDEGIELEGGKVPIVYVQAKNKKHALELILAAMSEYGTYDEDSIYEFVKTNEIDWADVKPFSDFASLNMGKLEKGWFDSDWNPQSNPDEQEEFPEKPKRSVVKMGDLWKLGDHRLYCGDSTTRGSYDSLCIGPIGFGFTSPPYGVGLAYRTYEDTFDNLMSLLDSWVPAICSAVDDGAHVLINFADIISGMSILGTDEVCELPMGAEYFTRFRKEGWFLHSRRIWQKPLAATNDPWTVNSSRASADWEHLWCFKKPGQDKSRRNKISFRGVWSAKDFQHETSVLGKHPGAFPVYIVRAGISVYSSRGDKVIDPFCGNGTVIVACEQTDRVGLGIELDPGYCDVVIERWQRLTGHKAERIHGKQTRSARSKA